MQRTKLQAAVRQAVYGQPVVATEGFLGDAIDKIKAVFTGSAGHQVLTPDEIKRGKIDVQSAMVRLTETVLNNAWLTKAELATGNISAKWAIPGLDYKAKLSAEKPTAHLGMAISDFLATLKVYSNVVKKHSQEGQKLYSILLKKLVKTNGDSKAVLAVLEEGDVEFAKIIPPYKHMATHPIDLIGNANYSFKDGKVVRDEKPCASENLPTLDKTQIVELAKLVTDFLEQDPEDMVTDNQDFIDWDSIGHDLQQAGASSEVANKILEELPASTFLNAFEYQNAWDDKAVSLLYKGTGDIVTRILLWINASIK